MRVWILALVVIIVIIVVVLVLRNNDETYEPVPVITTHELFGKKAKILSMPQIKTPAVPQDYRAFNPSVLNVNNQLMYIYRMSNATNCSMEDIDDNDKYLTANNPRKSSFIALTNGEHIVDVLTDPIGGKRCSKGFEDPRAIVSADGQNIYIVANALTGLNCRNEMWMLEIPTATYTAVAEAGGSLVPTRTIQLKTTFDLTVPQKNWMPFNDNDNLLFVYSVNPHIILRCDPQSGECKKFAETSSPHLPQDLRGGSQVVKYHDKRGKAMFIAAIHRRTKGHSYLTHFYTFETKWPYKVTAISDDFKFSDADTKPQRIQFVAGMQIVKRKTEAMAVLTYGEEDCYARECDIPMQEVLATLKPIDMRDTEVIKFDEKPVSFI